MNELIITPQVKAEIQRVVNEFFFSQTGFFFVFVVLGLFLAIVWVLYEFSWKENLKSSLAKEVSKQAQTLGHQFAREMEDYKKYVDKKHMVYVELNQLLLFTHSRVIEYLNAISLDPNLEEMTLEEVISYLESSNSIKVGKKVLEQFKQDWPNLSIDIKWERYHHIKKKLQYDALYNTFYKANNFFLLNKIYLSQPLEVEVENTFKNLKEIFGRIQIESSRPYNMGTADELNRTRKEIESFKVEFENSLTSLSKLMREDLSSGHYKKDENPYKE